MASGQDQPRKALGRGLSSLLPGNKPAAAAQAAAPADKVVEKVVERVVVVEKEAAPGPLRIRTDSINVNPLQPRTVFQEERLQELAQSIKENGIIQPLVVRKAGDGYQLIAGERRLRAARLAGLEEVPVVVQDFADDRLMEVTLIENIQREDLNPIEVAHAFERLAREHHLSHEQIAQRTGKERSTVTNMLRLLRLPGEVQKLVAEQQLSMGHARALLGLATEEAQVALGQKAAVDGLSVRQVEKAVQKLLAAPEGEGGTTTKEVRVDPNVKAAIEEMERVLGTRVRIVERGESRGRIEIEYYSTDELTRLYETIVGS